MNYGIILHLLILKPFKDKAMDYYNIFNELSVSTILIILSIFIKNLSDSSINKLD